MAAKGKDTEQEAQRLFNTLIDGVPRDGLWPVIVGLLRHVLLDEAASIQDYSYGVFAMTDTLRDAAFLQSEKGDDVETDIRLLTKLRRSHLL